MRFEWDESKNRINREKHGLDFEAVFTFDWENALLADRTRESDGEQRYAALGLYAGKIHTVVFGETRSQHPDHQYEAIQSSRGTSLCIG